MSYYRDQLNRVDTKGDYSPSFQIKSEKGDTKWMGLNKESAQDLREWLDENYPIPDKFIQLEEVQDRKSEMENFGRDTR
jgi:hypothetical protein